MGGAPAHTRASFGWGNLIVPERNCNRTFPPLRLTDFSEVVTGDSAVGKCESPPTKQQEDEMKAHSGMWKIANLLIVCLAVPLWTAAQDNPSPDNEPKHKKYRVVDLGTLGGAQSTVSSLNDQGLLVGDAETAISLSSVSKLFCLPTV